MTYCPFQRPEIRVFNPGKICIQMLCFSQHEGFLYQRTYGKNQSNLEFHPWNSSAFSNLIYVQRGSIAVSAPDRGVIEAKENQWLFVSALNQPLLIKIQNESLFHSIECNESVWNALNEESGPGYSTHSRLVCISCNKRNEALVFVGAQNQKMRMQLLELNQLQGKNSVERLKVASLSYELLSTTLESKELSSNPKSDPCNRNIDIEALDAAAKFLEENLDADHSIQKLSRQFYLNEFKLKKGFKARYQTTVFGYLRKKRMEHAKTLILQNKASVLEVATQVGYSNPSHFTRAFREAYGVNPGALKRD